MGEELKSRFEGGVCRRASGAAPNMKMYQSGTTKDSFYQLKALSKGCWLQIIFTQKKNKLSQFDVSKHQS